MTALKLASLGATVAACDINDDALRELGKDLHASYGNTHRTYLCDVQSSSQCQATVLSCIQDLQAIDFVFNCAGVNPTALAITDTSDEYFDKLVNTNLRGPYNITRSVVPHLKRGAAIVNVASVAGLRASWGFSIVSSPSTFPLTQALLLFPGSPFLGRPWFLVSVSWCACHR